MTLEGVAIEPLLSSDVRDALKNGALAHVRLQAAVGLAVKLPQVMGDFDEEDQQLVRLESESRGVTAAALEITRRFVAKQPEDRDAQVVASLTLTRLRDATDSR